MAENNVQKKKNQLDGWGDGSVGNVFSAKACRPDLEPSVYIKIQAGCAGACELSSWAVDRGRLCGLVGFGLDLGSVKDCFSKE